MHPLPSVVFASSFQTRYCTFYEVPVQTQAHQLVFKNTNLVGEMALGIDIERETVEWALALTVEWDFDAQRSRLQNRRVQWGAEAIDS